MTATLNTDYFNIDVSARKRYLDGTSGTYGWVYDTSIDIGRNHPMDPFVGHVQAQGLYEEPTVKMIQAITGSPMKHLRNLCVRAQDEAYKLEIEERQPQRLHIDKTEDMS